MRSVKSAIVGVRGNEIWGDEDFGVLLLKGWFFCGKGLLILTTAVASPSLRRASEEEGSKIKVTRDSAYRGDHSQQRRGRQKRYFWRHLH